MPGLHVHSLVELLLKLDVVHVEIQSQHMVVEFALVKIELKFIVHICHLVQHLSSHQLTEVGVHGDNGANAQLPVEVVQESVDENVMILLRKMVAWDVQDVIWTTKVVTRKCAVKLRK